MLNKDCNILTRDPTEIKEVKTSQSRNLLLLQGMAQ